MSDKIKVENQDGITVGDVVDAIHAWSVDVLKPSESLAFRRQGKLSVKDADRRNRYKQPPTEELRQQVLGRMLESLGWDGSNLVVLNKFETREAMLEELYDQESAV
jgi:hypothetical protein